MAKYSLHGGHTEFVQGANWGNRKEHIMDRLVKDAVAAKLRALGHTVYDDTDEVGRTQAQNLSNIVRKCNSHDVDLVISFHLNAYDGKANGVEVCYYDQQALAAKVSAQLSKDIGWSNRGAKKRTDLYVLTETKAPAILIELGFIDNDADMSKWHVDNIANSVVYALTGQRVGGSGNVATPSTKQNIIQTGAFSPYEVPDVAGAMKSLNMTGTFILKGDGLMFVVTDPTSDTQLKAMKEYLDRKKWWYEDK
ncbi:TPA: N-acetylmuramoyl-L-alanine amidase [Bacillus cereus]|uniref:N-acetylmuramoyl-L-alanine amidase n=1 Tax=Sphingobacterium tenebrionis TaxID=3111775 RepID=A0ABU8I973_9SPHI|nr:N-acetylmuramoyl-L-alanine amidase [Bacillus cereus]MBL3768328.1 N-acetylmuramoyl-L-alanine amidase [Bacillus cereus]MBL3774307.1 N-acetylmuramoyl-L-alanine amidase [Bacillus cereus]MBL3780075.1 N-acetylmuramoyl-L-alanine amidase [Bacillus cereus]MBL3791146.1 N-acetylmuramoyl-L-alanine amidase [Bacillus cereus]HDR4393124.1 N-acetylmuramoyl-L-alanine amidase [Bacillus cereus]